MNKVYMMDLYNEGLITKKGFEESIKAIERKEDEEENKF